MSIGEVTAISSTAIYLIIKTSAPVLIVSLIIGLTVSIFQTVTSIQEQTLTFVPKIMGEFLALIVLGQWMINNMSGFMVDLWTNFDVYIR